MRFYCRSALASAVDLVDHNRNMALVDHNRNMALVDHNRNMALLVAIIGIDTVSGPKRYKITPVLPGGLVIQLGEGPGRQTFPDAFRSDMSYGHNPGRNDRPG